MVTRKEYALNYFEGGFIPIPLCWGVNGKCACFIKHTDPKQIGKAPLVRYTDMTITQEVISEWFTRFPHANIGLLIRESGLVIVDADSHEAIQEYEQAFKGAQAVPNVVTGRGKHYYYRATFDTPKARKTHVGTSEMIDIFSDGYIVAPPSVHRNGHTYKWNIPPKKGLSDVPSIINRYLLHESGAQQVATVHVSGEIKSVSLDGLPLNDFVKSLIHYGEQSPYYRERGYLSRSEALFGMIRACYQQGLTDEQIFAIFTDSENALSYRYSDENRSSSWLLKEMARAKARAKNGQKKQ